MKTDPPSNALITPLPWSAHKGQPINRNFEIWSNGCLVADFNTQDNAEYCVKAANAYPKLVAALDKLSRAALMNGLDSGSPSERAACTEARELFATL